MPKLLFARPPADAVEERKIRKLAGARHAPADWTCRAQIIALSCYRAVLGRGAGADPRRGAEM